MDKNNCLGVSDPGTVYITGASAGIGLEFAIQLAQQGFNLVLIARRKEVLQEKAKKIEETSHVKVEVLVADLNLDADVKKIEDHMRGNPRLDILINNAGFGSTGNFADANFDFQMSMLRVHNMIPVRLMRVALEKMIPQNRGAIINTCSLQSFQAAGGSAMYASTKAFLRVFSESVATEIEGSKVRIQALCPGFTHTEFHSVGELTGFNQSVIPNAIWMSVQDVVHISLKAITKNQIVVIPGTKNKFLKFFMTVWPFSEIAKKTVKSKGAKGKGKK